MSSKKKPARLSRGGSTPQKSVRPSSAQWHHCVQCDTWLPEPAPDGQCCLSPPPRGCVRAGRLLASGWLQPAPQQAWPPGWARALCLVPAPAAGALGLRAGDRVQVVCGRRRAVCRLWPLPAGTDSPPAAVAVPEPTAARLTPLDEPPALRPVTGALLPAARLQLAPDRALPFAGTDRFREQLAVEMRGLVFGVGDRYVTSFMGTPLTLTVTEVTEAGAEDELACRLARLAVSGSEPPAGVGDGPAAVPSSRKSERRANLDDRLVEVAEETELVVSLSSEPAPPPPPPPRLGGVTGTLKYLRSMIDQVLKEWRPDDARPVLELPRGVLLWGPSGTGKSALATVLAAEYGSRFHLIRGAQLASKYQGGTEENLRNSFEAARRHRPAVLFIDNVEAVAGRSDTGSERQRRLLTCLLSLLDDAAGLAVVAATAAPGSLDPAVRRAGRLDRELELTVPGPADRTEILTALLPDRPADQLAAVAAAAHGYVGADLRAVVSEARLLATERSEHEPTLADLMAALRRVKPSAMREVLVEVADVRWKDIGGQEALKLRLKQAVDWPINHPEAFKRMGVTPPKGVLMYGPPGCSKTMIAKALATESGLNFISIKGPELFSKWVGESERAVREVFRRARQSAPAVVFFDELDALAVRRGDSGASSVAERVLAQLLTEIDGVSALRDVTVVAATNRPDLIDPALLRPGRLDHVVHVPLPDAETRAEIGRIRLAGMPVAAAVTPQWLSERTEGYSGAEVSAVCHEAALLALERDVEAATVELEDFQAALRTVQPRVTDYDLVYRQFAENHRKR
ncbi:Spermatogenesis-associated protein 5 [Amphibalanus amphitrite]|uniref:Spermatogenesis-associated protein 5 n=1 Tax=Amphibalanus amphitrite TaxID=1232801 RepID=A0A6A4W6M4_AMPAM|nr:Spermatogenesis-associated protein 5 [Amphibalanus amphitrite]